MHDLTDLKDKDIEDSVYIVIYIINSSTFNYWSIY